MRQRIYFLLAAYLQRFARIILNRWQPFVVLVTGTAGKTTAYSLIQTVLIPQIPVRIAHKANGVHALALDILGLKQTTFSVFEWLKLLVLAPFRIWQRYSELVYLVEADTDREQEMEYHTELLKPDITCFTSCYPMHTQNFPGDVVISQQRMAHDFGFAIERAQKLVLVNGEVRLIRDQLARTSLPKGLIALKPDPDALLTLESHTLSLSGTDAVFHLKTAQFDQLYLYLQPQAQSIQRTWQPVYKLSLPLTLLSRINMYGLGMALVIGLLFDIPFEDIRAKLQSWRLPPGRMSIFAGIHGTTILDSSYNASKEAMIDALKVLQHLGGRYTLAVLGDMRELGTHTQSQHEQLAEVLIHLHLDRLILVGPAMNQFVVPILEQYGYRKDQTLFGLATAKAGRDLLITPDFLRPGETLLVKGSQNTLLMEGIIEPLLASKKDLAQLCRREQIWKQQREKVYG